MTTLEEQKFTFGSNKTTFYLTAGPTDGPLLIFVHGWPAIAKVWKAQLMTFASLGFRVVAPDMPGYGSSTATKKVEDYAQESINLGMVALLEHLERDKAVWIGHDWGCGAVWSFAAHYPDKCVAVAGISIPYGMLELGLEELLKTVDRDIYPVEQYPYGQWSYMDSYEKDLEGATSWLNSDIPAVIRLIYSKADPASFGKPARTANMTKSGVWFGTPKPDPNWRQLPIERNVLDEETYAELVAAMQRTGFWGASAWYFNHSRNRAYSLDKWKDNGYIRLPVLFIHGEFDAICSTSINSRLCGPMRRYCTNLTECTINAGHWVAQEKPVETSAAITRWLVESCKEHWPGYWENGHITGINKPTYSA